MNKNQYLREYIFNQISTSSIKVGNNMLNSKDEMLTWLAILYESYGKVLCRVFALTAEFSSVLQQTDDSQMFNKAPLCFCAHTHFLDCPPPPSLVIS